MATREPEPTSRAASNPIPHLPPITIPSQTPRDVSAQQHQRLSLSPKEVLHGLASRFSPRPLTGAAAFADARRARLLEKYRQEKADSDVSHNQAILALNALMGRQDMSKPTDAPAESRPGQSPQTSTAPATEVRHEATTNMTSTPIPSDSQMVEEPESMDDGVHDEEDESPTQEGSSARPFTYPGLAASHGLETPTRRDSSAPGSATYDSGQKSTKRHKCPHCATDFTRHHNLKSHLLTHSQEKPYVCQTCSASFRRLHDLKRHAKLHTGERPHTCPKCGRKFARGDALARHNKGPGGCANRKSSFGADDDGEGDDTMDGLEYDEAGDERGDDHEMMDDLGRRVSEPIARKRPHEDTSPQESNLRHSRTYPPPLARSTRQETAASMGPPQSLVSPTFKAFPETLHQPEHQATSPYYSQSHGSSSFPATMTESPRPLSPREPHRLSVGDPPGLRNNSPSLSSSYYGSRSSGSLPMPGHVNTHAPQLPSLPGLAAGPPVQPPAHVAPPSFPPHHSAAPHSSTAPLPGSNPSSHSSHGHSSSGSMRDLMAQDQQDMYAYVRTLEQRLSRMQDEYELRIARLQADVIDLKAQVYKGR